MATHRLDAYRLYLLYGVLGGCCSQLVFVPLAVYYITVAHLDPLQLVLVGTVLEGAYFLFEVPTGVLADTFSRRRSLIIGLALIGAAFILEGLVPLFAAILLAEAVRGVGHTFTSGATEAWIAGEVGDDRLGHVFTRAAQATMIGSIVGILAGGALGSIRINLPVVLGGAGFVAQALFFALAMPETGFRPAPRGEHSTWQAMGQTFLRGVRAVRKQPLLITFLAVAIVSGMSSEGFDRLWEAHFLANVPFPQFNLPGPDLSRPVVWFSLLTLGAMLLSMVAVELVRRTVDTGRYGSIARALVALTALQVVCIVGFGLAGAFVPAVAAYWGVRVARSATAPLSDAWLASSIEPRVRATVLSMTGQADAFGQIVCGPVVGAIGVAASLRAAMTVAGVALLPSLPLFARARRQATEGDEPPAEQDAARRGEDAKA